jgi:RNA polymerase sigma-70 factor (ECF subfamily)
MLRVAEGDRVAYARLVDHSRDGLFRYLRSLVRDDAAAEDALQEVLIGVWRGARRWRSDGSARVWMYGIARRQAARSWRRRAGQPDHLESLEALAVAAGFGDARDPEQLVAALEDQARVHAALDRLSDDDREVLTLRDLEGLSGGEVAEILEIDLAAMKSRLHRARLRLLANLRSDGGDDV